MALTTPAELIELCRTLRLVEPGKLEEIARRQSAFADARGLAAELIRTGALTAYQVNLLFQGRGRELVLEPYVILERLGEGGMGQVYKGRHMKMQRTVALKVIRKDRLQNPQALRRFQREIQAVAALSHPNIVMAHDANQVGDTHFYAMEYVEGKDLARLVKQRGPLPVADACAYVRQAALGLQHALEQGLIHRDIKPSNLMVSGGVVSGERSSVGTDHSPLTTHQIKILDMGLARLDTNMDDTASDMLTQEGAVVGTLDFLAPEQAQDARQADIRSDLYSLGCTLYFMLAGRAPFAGGTATEKLLKHRLEEAEPIEKLRPDVPPGVAGIVRMLMAKRPEDRYQTPAELIWDLDHPERVRPKKGWSGHAMRGLLSWCRRRPRLTLGVVAVLVIGLGLTYALSGRPRYHAGLGYHLKKHPSSAVEFKGHWYAFIPGKVPSWAEAYTRCQEMGGYLVCIKTAEEQEFVRGLTAGQNAWLGGYNDAKQKWFWITGEPITLFFWEAGQPNNGPSVFMEMIQGKWHDIGRNEQTAYAAGFVCEWDF
jgi:serine/threonine-protein kinase